MNLGATRIGLAASAALAIVAAAAVMPASAQSKIYPEGTDCTKLVGNSKTECANRAIQNGSRDDSNNPDQQN
jgi:hypothetical protein